METALRTARVAAAVMLGLAVLTFVLAVALWFTYFPTGAQAWGNPALGGGSGWTEWHRWVAVLWVVSTGASVAALVVLGLAHDSQHSAGALGGALLSGIAAIVVLVTRGLVQWDQVGLWAVTVVGGFDGYWSATDDAVVRFVIVDGNEVDPGYYRVMLLTHMTAHVAGVLGATVTVVDLIRRGPIRRSSVRRGRSLRGRPGRTSARP